MRMYFACKSNEEVSTNDTPAQIEVPLSVAGERKSNETTDNETRGASEPSPNTETPSNLPQVPRNFRVTIGGEEIIEENSSDSSTDNSNENS